MSLYILITLLMTANQRGILGIQSQHVMVRLDAAMGLLRGFPSYAVWTVTPPYNAAFYGKH